jgi:hypothetical protein
MSDASSTGCAPNSYNFSIISETETLTEIMEDKAIFFTRPQFDPSGVSAGHILPKCVE